MQKQMVTQIVILFFAVVFTSGVVYSIIHYMAVEEARLKKIAEQVEQAKAEMQAIILANKDKPLDEIPNHVDPWGNPYSFGVEETQEKVFKNYRAYSLGPDQKSGTKDDIIVSDTDFSWTHAGEATGVRVGRTARGFFSGLWKSDDKK